VGPSGTITIDPPPNPQGQAAPVQACAIATYLAQNVLKVSLNQAVIGFQNDISLVTTVASTIALIPVLGIESAIAIDGIAILYRAVGSGTISDYNAALADPTVWAKIKCAIVAAMGNDGGITSDNTASVIAAVGGVSGVNAGVLTTMTDYMTHLGTAGLQAAVLAGGLITGDCTGCGDWRFRWSPATNDGDAHFWVPTTGHYIPGVGWEPIYPGGDALGRYQLDLDIRTTFAETYITSMSVQWTATESEPYHSGGYANRGMYATSGSYPPGFQGTSFDNIGGQNYSDAWVINSLETYLDVGLNYDGDDHATTEFITGIQVTGTGVCPWGRSNY
jgi:hypothetical protein